MFLVNLLYLIAFILPMPTKIYNTHIKTRTKIHLDSNLTRMLEPPSGGELKLLTHLSVENWAHNWVVYIANSNLIYDDHYYLDYFNMKGMANMYTSSEYFYLGFFPDSIITNQGPKYIGLFYLNHKKRIFGAKCIIENPYYMDTSSELDAFKDHLINLTNSAYVFFDYKELDRPGQVRYYLEWKLN
jgi:hypothetical protein